MATCLPSIPCIPCPALWVAVVAAMGLTARSGLAGNAEDLAFFRAEVEPLLQNRCFECHSHEAKKAKGGLVLDSRSGWKEGGDSGPAVVAGKPEDSLLIKAVRHTDKDLEMPPKKKLTGQEIEILTKWVAAGAPDPRDGAGTSKAVTGLSLEEGRRFWSMQPVADPTPDRPIDDFIIEKLSATHLLPAPPADPPTLLRRVTFDLTGLPPTLEQMSAFAADPSERAYEKVVDELLHSRAFAERWARHWLDLTGYADTIGLGRAIPAPNAWRYRDYVINAFHTDMPYDRFIREQIAGDVQRSAATGFAGDPPPTADSITATGFLAIGPWELVNGDKVQLRMDVIDRQITRVGLAFLGMTLGCARCHDHKFDPVTQADYYAMAGIFRSSVTLDGRLNGVFSAIHETALPETPAGLIARAKEMETFEKKLSLAKAESQKLSDAKQKLDAELKALHDRKDDTLAPQIADLEKKIEAESKLAGEAAAAVKLLEFLRPAEPRAMAMHDRPEAEDCAINIRGNARQLGASVPRGFVKVMLPEGKPAAFAESGSGRKELAAWIADAQNPLTARVMANRIWFHLFGQGIVRSVDNFGVRGEPPTHPALLDHLAARFVRDGWSVKKLVRGIVLTHTYRQSSAHHAEAFAKDPDNRLLWRSNRRRLDAESLRDALLAISGKLKPGSGGPSLPLGIPGNVNLGGPPSIKDDPQIEDTMLCRRTIYQPVKRKNPFEKLDLLAVFDFPDPNDETGQRTVTTVPTQALYLMNSPLLREVSAGTVQRVFAMADQDDSRLRELHRLILNRDATAVEMEKRMAFLESYQARQVAESGAPEAPQASREDSRRAAWEALAHSLLASNPFLFLE